MAHLATLEEVKSGLRIEADDDDDSLKIMIEAASQLVLRYIKRDATTFDDFEAGVTSEGESTLDSADVMRLRQATIMLVGYWFRNPDADPDGDFERGYMPNPITALLYDLRDPTLA